ARAVEPQHGTGRAHEATELQARLPEAAAEVEHAVARANVEARYRDVTVDLAVPGEQVTKPHPFRREDLVPAPDEVFVFDGDARHGGAPVLEARACAPMLH